MWDEDEVGALSVQLSLGFGNMVGTKFAALRTSPLLRLALLRFVHDLRSFLMNSCLPLDCKGKGRVPERQQKHGGPEGP